MRSVHRPDGRADPRQVGLLGRAAGGVAAAVAVGDRVEHEHRRAALVFGAAHDPLDRLTGGALGRVGEPRRDGLLGDHVDACGRGALAVGAGLGCPAGGLVVGVRLHRQATGERCCRRRASRTRGRGSGTVPGRAVGGGSARPAVTRSGRRPGYRPDGEHDGDDEPGSDERADGEHRPLPTSAACTAPAAAVPLFRHASMLAGGGAPVPGRPGVRPGGSRAPASGQR